MAVMQPMDQRTAVPAILAILLALGGFLATFSGHPAWGLILEILAIPLGVTGAVMAISPWVGGGLLSMISVVLAVIGALLSLLMLIGHIGAAIVR